MGVLIHSSTQTQEIID